MSEELNDLEAAEWRGLADWTPERSVHRMTLSMTVEDSDFWNDLIKTLSGHMKGEGLRPDLLVLKTGPDLKITVATKGEGEDPKVSKWESLEFKVPVVFEPVENTLGCVIAGTLIALELGRWPRLWQVREWLTTNNQRLGIGTAPEVLAEAFALEAPAHKSLAPRVAALPSALCFTGDNIHRAAITAWARAAEWQAGDKYFRGLEQEYSNLKITVSLPNGDQAASLWEFLQKGGAAMVKAHYALWARYYEQVPDGLSLEYVVVNVSDFCRDLGYSKHKGAYKPEAKRRAMQLLEALTSTQMAATYQVPGQKKGHTKTRRLKGTIWARGLEAEERDTYEDLLGHSRAGAPEMWTPCSFSFAPGPWHADKDWRRYNRFVGKIGAGLMKLDNRYDEWAILIGGYLGTLARTGKYRARRLKIGTILENTGLARTDTHRKTEHREKFYRALDRLVEEKIIAAYKTEGFDDSDVDPDDLAALAAYGTSDPFPAGDWRAAIVEITFDFAADMNRLAARQKTAIAAKSKKHAKPKEPKAPPPAA